MLTQPNLIPMPFANGGDANTIPETNPTPSTTSAASWTSGFPVINSTPLAAGGIPPAREDFNGAFKALSEHTMWEQSGNPYTWSEDLDYVTNARAQGSDGKMYVAKQNSGPNTDAGAQDPTTDDTDDYWILEEDLYGAKRNPGELVYSMLPIEDASLHLVDGTVLSGSGMYADFVSYVAGLIENQPNSSNVYKVGNLADVDNVLSGFTTSSYAKLPFAFSPGSSPWEMVFKITTGGDVSTGQTIVATQDDYDSVELYISTGKFVFNASSNNASFDIANGATGTYSVQANTSYYVKLTFSGSAYTIAYSLDGSSYTTDITVSSSTAIHGGNTMLLGTSIGSGVYQNSFLGSIDLTGSHININSSRWWSGTHKAGFMDETEWQASVSKYGVCGCFVYDSIANTLRLPKVDRIEGTVDPTALGALVEAGLPNITGGDSTVSRMNFVGNIPNDTPIGTTFESGALKVTCTQNGSNQSGTAASLSGLTIDASLSSSIYGNSETVQPQAIKGFVYMVVSNRTKTQIVADIDEIAADLQLKADVDLGNVTSAGQVRMAHAAMPSGQYEDLTLPANGGTVTAPADGFIQFGAVSTASGQACSLSYHGISWSSSITSVGRQNVGVTCPVPKGAIVTVNYTSMNGSFFRFTYANGSATA